MLQTAKSKSQQICCSPLSRLSRPLLIPCPLPLTRPNFRAPLASTRSPTPRGTIDRNSTIAAVPKVPPPRFVQCLLPRTLPLQCRQRRVSWMRICNSSLSRRPLCLSFTSADLPQFSVSSQSGLSQQLSPVIFGRFLQLTPLAEVIVSSRARSRLQSRQRLQSSGVSAATAQPVPATTAQYAPASSAQPAFGPSAQHVLALTVQPAPSTALVQTSVDEPAASNRASVVVNDRFLSQPARHSLSITRAVYEALGQKPFQPTALNAFANKLPSRLHLSPSLKHARLC